MVRGKWWQRLWRDEQMSHAEWLLVITNANPGKIKGWMAFGVGKRSQQSVEAQYKK